MSPFHWVVMCVFWANMERAVCVKKTKDVFAWAILFEDERKKENFSVCGKKGLGRLKCESLKEFSVYNVVSCSLVIIHN